MKTPSHQKTNGIVAILDALGAGNYGDKEIELFINARRKLLLLLENKALALNINATNLGAFTFNDTILVTLDTGETPKLSDLKVFFRMMRHFFVESLTESVLFRGSVAIGDFYVNKQTSTVMGRAVTEAAEWHNKADWIGMHTTPRTTMLIQHGLKTGKPSEQFVLEYDVPIKEGPSLRSYVPNWPKGFLVDGITPCGPGDLPRQKLLDLLNRHRMPLGTERKYFDTLDFFDFAMKKINEKD